MNRRIATLAGAIGFAVTALVMGTSSAAASPSQGPTCRAVPSVIQSGNDVIFSGFTECQPYVNGGKIFVVAYVGPRDVQEFKQRTDTRCPIDPRCVGAVIRLPNPPGPQTYCSYVEGHLGNTEKTVIIPRAKFCREL